MEVQPEEKRVMILTFLYLLMILKRILRLNLKEYKGKYTKAQVAYTYTSLGPAGDEFVEDLTEANYEAFMKHWESELNHFLKTGERLPEN